MSEQQKMNNRKRVATRSSNQLELWKIWTGKWNRSL